MTKILHVGLGPLGQKTVKFALERGFKIVAAVDPAPDKVGKDLGELCGLKKLGVKIRPTVAAALKGKKADVAVVTTVSGLRKLLPQVEELAKKKLPIVSTCEELSFPWRTQPALARKIDAICKKRKIALLGTGVNPGYLMDYLPTALTAIAQRVDAIKVSRIQDATVRRVPFQQKIGAGLTVEEFRQKEKEGTLRHVGLPESVDLIAARMGWKLTRKSESLDPVLADREITSGFKPIHPGMACGVEQIGRGFVGDKEVITLHFRAAVGEPKAYDTVEVVGEPSFRSTIEGGINGDIATCAITLNAIASILEAKPGLRTMSDVMPVAYSK
ncbi:MAG: dihydrodipicolinate reductase [Oligoflexia bacterium]|nr:dihydrodipicolinate reductase [Oligoflexia bacterium]